MQSLRSVVVVPQGQEQQELSPRCQGAGRRCWGRSRPRSRSLPHTPGRDIVCHWELRGVPEDEGGTGWQRRHWNRRWAAQRGGSHRPIRERAVASSSSAGRTITREMVAEACDTLVQERHPPPHLCGPRATGALQRTSRWKRRERPESWQNLLPRSGSWHRRPHRRGTDPPEERSGSRSRPVQPQPRRRAGAGTIRVQPRARDQGIRE